MHPFRGNWKDFMDLQRTFGGIYLTEFSHKHTNRQVVHSQSFSAYTIFIFTCTNAIYVTDKESLTQWTHRLETWFMAETTSDSCRQIRPFKKDDVYFFFVLEIYSVLLLLYGFPVANIHFVNHGWGCCCFDSPKSTRCGEWIRRRIWNVSRRWMDVIRFTIWRVVRGSWRRVGIVRKKMF